MDVPRVDDALQRITTADVAAPRYAGKGLRHVRVQPRRPDRLEPAHRPAAHDQVLAVPLRQGLEPFECAHDAIRITAEVAGLWIGVLLFVEAERASARADRTEKLVVVLRLALQLVSVRRELEAYALAVADRGRDYMPLVGIDVPVSVE